MSTRGDKIVEKERYENRSKTAIENNWTLKNFGAKSVDIVLRAPYIAYETLILDSIKRANGGLILEIGAGNGVHTKILVETGLEVVATDISLASLELLVKNLNNPKNLKTEIADIESLPFSNDLFDFVVSAGSLSYGDSIEVMREIYRVLKPGGIFVCVDSLNHNPVYRLNREINYWRGLRSRSTQKNMPSIDTIKQYENMFNLVQVKYYGAISYLMPALKQLFGDKNAARISDWFDITFSIKKSAFKFVMLAIK